MSALRTGFYDVEIRCPDCKRELAVEAELLSIHTSRSDGEGSLRLALKSKPLDHRCNQPTLFEDEP